MKDSEIVALNWSDSTPDDRISAREASTDEMRHVRNRCFFSQQHTEKGYQGHPGIKHDRVSTCTQPNKIV